MVMYCNLAIWRCRLFCVVHQDADVLCCMLQVPMGVRKTMRFILGISQAFLTRFDLLLIIILP